MATVLITGCNRGIGLALCRQYLARDDDVIAVCRCSSAELDATKSRVIEGVDVSTDVGVARLMDAVGGEKIDILINNAGIGGWDTLQSVDFDKMIEQYRVNTLGPLRVTNALINNLVEGSKVGIVTSRVGSIADNSSGNNYGYRCSKTAVNMIGMNLHHDLSPKGIAVILLHPGLVATDMTNGAGVTPTDSANGLIARIDDLDLSSSGTFWHAEGYELPW